jgi:hypothetical protein
MSVADITAEQTIAHDTAPAESEGESQAIVPDAAEAAQAAQDKRVPVTQAIRYRKRAQLAEQQLQNLQSQTQQLQAELDTARSAIAQLERRRQIDALLIESEAVDLDAARLLTEAAITGMDDADVKLVVDDLRRHKPYLFRHRHERRGGLMAPRLDDDADGSDQAALQAASTGDRRDLLRYLRLRRANR